MKKIKDYIRYWRRMAQTRSMTRANKDAKVGTSSQKGGESTSTKQEEVIMTPKMSSGNDGQPQLSIFINDFTDSDNEAAAEVWAWTLAQNPHITGIYIAEPRHVNLKHFTPGRDFGGCMQLVPHLVPEPKFPALTTVVGGRLTQNDIDNSKWGEYTIERHPNTNKVIKRTVIPDTVVELTDQQKKMLQCCIKPEKGRFTDAIRHARLLTLDYLTTMKTRCERPFQVFLDIQCLHELKDPINLKTHYHDELVARPKDELLEAKSILEKVSEDPNLTEEENVTLTQDMRQSGMEAWYKKAYQRKLQAYLRANHKDGVPDLSNLDPDDVCSGGMVIVEDDQHDYDPIKPLDMAYLRKEIRNEKYVKVAFFGGASLTVLHRILKHDEKLEKERPEKKLGKKIFYYQQGGTTDPSRNVLGNPYNFALNTEAAKYVFKNHHKLRRFVVIPTDTTQMIDYTMGSLRDLSPAVGLRSIAFHPKLEPWVLISKKELEGEAPRSDEEFLAWRAEDAIETYVGKPEKNADPKFDDPKYKKAVMADLTAFLVSFTDVWGTEKWECERYERGVVNDADEQMVLSYSEKSTIKSLMLWPKPAKRTKSEPEPEPRPDDPKSNPKLDLNPNSKPMPQPGLEPEPEQEQEPEPQPMLIANTLKFVEDGLKTYSLPT